MNFISSARSSHCYYYYLFFYVFSTAFLPLFTLHVYAYLCVRIYKWKSFRNYFSPTHTHTHNHPSSTPRRPYHLYFHITSAPSRHYLFSRKKITSSHPFPFFSAKLFQLPASSSHYSSAAPSRLFLFSVFGFINAFELTEGTSKNGLLFFIRTYIYKTLEILCVCVCVVLWKTKQKDAWEGEAFPLYKMFPFADINNKRKCFALQASTSLTRKRIDNKKDINPSVTQN